MMDSEIIYLKTILTMMQIRFKVNCLKFWFERLKAGGVKVII